jgi:hypothetical protein
VGIDRPDDAEMPSEEHPDSSADRADVRGDGGCQPDGSRRTPVEPRDRQQYYDDLRAADSANGRPEVPEDQCEVEDQSEVEEGPEKRDPGADERVTEEPWDKTAERSRGLWAQHRGWWPLEERPPVDRSRDAPGSWRGDSNRFLDRSANDHVDKQCDRIAETERDIVSPAMRAVESCNPDRHLVGFENRLKGQDRIKDKVAEGIEERGRTVTEAVSMVKDAIRYTFVYREEHYAEGVQADLGRMETRGFEQVERRNSWTEDQYKGINSRWREPGTGQMFEVQFHTRISFEAKQITHGAYERVRDPTTSRAELRDLRSFQRGVCEHIPVPPGAAEIPDYPQECR